MSWTLFCQALPLMGQGLAGVFAATLILVGGTCLLTRLFR